MDLLQPGFGLFFWTTLAFLTVFFLLRKFAWPHIINGLAEREENIANSIATAEKIKLEMSGMKTEHEQLMVQAREERAVIMKEAKEAKEKIVSDAKEQAKEEANKIIAEARTQILNEKMAAMTDIKNQVGNLVIEVSEKILRKELSNKPEQTEYIKKLANDIALN